MSSTAPVLLTIAAACVLVVALLERALTRHNRTPRGDGAQKSSPRDHRTTFRGSPLSRSLLGVKRTSLFALHMSAYDPKRA